MKAQHPAENFMYIILMLLPLKSFTMLLSLILYLVKKEQLA